MRRPWALLCTMFFLFVTASSFPQTKASSQAPATASSEHEEDNDSADIPPFARGNISEKDYLRLREQSIAVKRGVRDLMRNPQARSKAVRMMQSQKQILRQQQGAARAAGIPGVTLRSPTWSPLGPDPIPNGQVQSGSEIPVSGRVTAIAIDPTDSTGNTVYVGAASGGLYRSTDGGNSWVPLMDSAQSLSIGALTLDPTDHTTLFVGTGEANDSLDSFFGVGIYIITNANGASPTLSGPFNAPVLPNPDGFTDVFTGRSISQILVNPGNHNQILVSTTSGFSGAGGDVFNTLPTRGVYLSTNALSGSPTFTRLSIQSVADKNRPVTDMVMDANNPNLVVINIIGQTDTEGGIWVSPNTVWSGTGVWTQTMQTQLEVNGKFASNSSGSTTTFMVGLDQTVSTAPCNGAEGTLFKSVNGGQTWTEITAARGFCGGQCFYDISVAINPQNINNIYLGGSADGTPVNPSCTTNTFLQSTDGINFSRADVQLHADAHATAIFPGNPLIIYQGNDGGIFRSNDGGTTWLSLNTGGFTATQFESLAVHPTDPNFTIGGTQDNGTPMLLPSGEWTRVDFGDGGFSAIDSNATNTTNVTMYHTYFNVSNDLIGYAQISDGTAATEGNWNFSGCSNPPASGNGIGCADVVDFYAPLVLGPGSPNNTVYFGTDRLYRSTDQGLSNTVVSQAPLVANSPISAIGISPSNDSIRIVGMGEDVTTGVASGRVFATVSGASTLTEVTGPWTPEYIARAVIDPNSVDTAYITLDGYGTPNHVWKTTTLHLLTTTMWSSASGSSTTALPDVPVNAFAVDPVSSSILYAGTEIGVYASTDGGATWNPYGTGLPVVPVFDLKVAPGHKLRIATHGRGMWETAEIGFNDDTTTLLPSPSHAVPGGNVSLTATVNHPGNVTVPAGNMNFFDGNTLLSTMALNSSGVATFSTSSLALGTHSLTAVYAGDTGTAYIGSTSPAIQVTVGVVTTTTGLLVTPFTVPVLGTNLTLVANIDTDGNSTAPTGMVTFLDGSTPLQTVTLSSSNVASIQTSSLALGVHNITAAYSGDANYTASTSTVVAVTVVSTPEYSVSAPTPSVIVQPGQTATYAIIISSPDGFTGTVNFNCTSGLPSLTACAFAPTTVTGSGSTTLSITTTAPTSAPKAPNSSASLFTTGGLIGLGLFLAGGVAAKRPRVTSVFTFIALLGLMIVAISCGNHTTPPPPPNPGTPVGTSTVTITATSGTTSHTATVTLTVQ